MASEKDSAVKAVTEYVTVTIGNHLFGLPIIAVTYSTMAPSPTCVLLLI